MRWFALAGLLCSCSGLYSVADGGTGGGAGGGAQMGQCSSEAQCPHPENSTAVCTNGVCSFACASPQFPCGDACCKAVALTAGDTHTCMLTSAGAVRCWGAGLTVGDGTFDARRVATDVVGLTGPVASISAGLLYTCARLVNGEVQCWGVSTIGNGMTAPAPKATAILSGPVTAQASGSGHACVLLFGAVKCWGLDSLGQQGTGMGARTAPGEVPGVAYDVTQIAAGSAHTCALLNDGGARCWGFNVAGEVGDGTVQRRAAIAVTAVDAGISEIYAGFSFTCARVAGRLKCWGTNGQGECGYGVVSGRSLAAVDVVGNPIGKVALAPTASHACVIQDGGALCWGNDDHGQLGDANLGHQNAPVPVLGLTEPIIDIAVGGRHTCAITEKGGVLCWGDNTEGQLGDGTKGGNRLTPVTVR